MKVLIVDDNTHVRALLRTMLGGSDHVLLEAADGLEAVERCEEELPDVVLMDLRMPRLNGIEATRSIVRSHPRACILIVTDYDDTALRALAQSAGAERYFVKDSLDELKVYVESLRGQGAVSGKPGVGNDTAAS